jgi:hypothetical protein
LVKDQLAIETNDDAKGPLAGLHAALSSLKALWFTKDPDWKAIRDKVQVGLVKETEDCGNTSVSMGLAYRIMKETKEQNLVLLNCGTGGVKYQLYGWSADGCLIAKQEFKPKGEKDSLSRIQIHGSEYDVSKYSDKGFIQVEELRKQIEANLAIAKGQWKEYFETKEKDRRRVKVTQIRIVAFITGNVRNFYYNLKSPESKRLMDVAITKLFSTMNVERGAGSSFFISQQLEGKLEMQAVRTLYSNMQLKKRLPLHSPIVSFGIGRGTSQFTIAGDDPEDVKSFTTLSYPHGMGNIKGLLQCSEFISNQFQKGEPALKQLLSACQTQVNNNMLPTIALKSGTVLMFKNKKYGKQLLQALTKPPKVSKKKKKISHINIHFAMNGNAFIERRASRVNTEWSLDRLCAEAAKVKSKTCASAHTNIR